MVKFKLKAMKSSEHDLQYSIVAYLRYNGVMVFDMDVMSGLQYFTQQDPRRYGFINHHNHMGYRKGQPDIMIIKNDKIAFVEIKTLTGRQSPEQKEVEADIKKMGFDYLIWRSVDDAISWYNKTLEK